jgi:hypothetical protein
MVTFSQPVVRITGIQAPRVFVPVQQGTALMSSSERFSVSGVSQPSDVVEVREASTGTADRRLGQPR